MQNMISVMKVKFVKIDILLRIKISICFLFRRSLKVGMKLS
ncbi:hypothetical protein [Clostridium beijerinckii]|uniref:Uncharacterized protein n=1 Tax=Clostridium beijerinckii TaxID=1520 RepID=A0A9Q5CR34_CLOBE|nr:hypothetical protein [Clostridium beijerinckii]NRT00005.1 hypothetical protein [Clostridium beijerinckii]NRT49162.1 hypothetical protein [Clostridium beijerinckii]NRT96429.1 hypothetical protein [Clostridium beijerinckii]NRU24760.1 hypothetical protein [Clostridium beijerinckii]NRU41835.1 hypothetical protein [Clostridium beijerinckii]